MIPMSAEVSRKRRRAKRWICASVGVIPLLASRSARAITIRADVSDSLYTAQSAQPAYASSGYVQVISNTVDSFGSGTLIAPDWILTAAHTVTVNEVGPALPASEVTFGMGASTTPFTTGPDAIARIIVDPSYNGSITAGNDLALLQLTTPITNIAPAMLYNSSLGSELGLTATAVGYGLTGTGNTGSTQNAGTRRAMNNIIDAFGGMTTIGGTPQSPSTYSFQAYNSNLLFTDFDSPSPSLQQYSNLMGSSNALSLEGGIASGDSGGGVYVNVNNQNYLAAMIDFAGNFFTNPTGRYGDYDGYIRLGVSDSANFLSSNMGGTSTWIQSGGGTWCNRSFWDNSNIPEFQSSTANFGSAITSPSTVSLDCAWTVGTINFSNSNSYTLTAGSNGTLTLDAGGIATAALISVTSGSHQITAPLALNSPLRVSDTFFGMLSLSGPITGAVPLTVSGNGTLKLKTGAGNPTFTSLTVNTGATLDITTNIITINYASPNNDPVATIAAQLKSGYKNGSWSGAGINSSDAGEADPHLPALGYADGNNDPATIATPNQLIIRYTLAGDANLDGTVNFQDLVAVIQNFNKTGRDWSQGNFTYSSTGDVNFNDLVMVVQNFNQTLQIGQVEQSPNSDGFGTVSISDTAVQLPEPAAGAVLLPLLALRLRRRRNSKLKIQHFPIKFA